MKTAMRQRRESLGITQVALAKTLGVSQALISRIERGGDQGWSLTTAAVAEALSCSEEELWPRSSCDGACAESKPTPTADREALYLRGVPVEVIEAIDAIAHELSVERGSRVTRSDVVREALARTAREHRYAPAQLGQRVSKRGGAA